MKKLYLFFSFALIFLFQACQPDTGKGVNEDNEPSQSILDADETGSASGAQDSSTVRMEEHTRLNNAADSAKAEEEGARNKTNNKR